MNKRPQATCKFGGGDMGLHSVDRAKRKNSTRIMMQNIEKMVQQVAQLLPGSRSILSPHNAGFARRFVCALASFNDGRHGKSDYASCCDHSHAMFQLRLHWATVRRRAEPSQCTAMQGEWRGWGGVGGGRRDAKRDESSTQPWMGHVQGHTGFVSSLSQESQHA